MPGYGDMTDTEHADIPTRSDAARTAAWSTFGEAIHAIHATTGTDRLRRYADACFAAGDAYRQVRTWADDDD